MRSYEYCEYFLWDSYGKLIISFESKINIDSQLEKYLEENNNKFVIEEFKEFIKTNANRL